MPPLLISLDGNADIPLDQLVVVVGRHSGCSVRIASPRVSRRHCCLALDRDGVLVRDLGSTNGTRINRQRIEEGVLRSGDELSIAHYRYRLEGFSADDPDHANPVSHAAP
jgi:pSer/pThr/pTyr-binding forkhead associated (FHA) protein